MKNNIRKKFINLLLLEINKFNKHKKDIKTNDTDIRYPFIPYRL
jgi:hypothetical protein